MSSAPPKAGAAFDAAAFASVTGATSEQVETLTRFRDLLAEWSGRMNLVGPTALEAFWPRHVLDSAQLLGLAPEARRWADAGAGAGFPGVVLAILLKGVPGATVELIDSAQKRCRFLDAVVEALALPARVHCARVEALNLKVDVVTARAVAPLPRLLGYTAPLLKRGAQGLFLKGRDVETELTEAAKSWTFRHELIPSLSDPSGRVLRIWSLSRAPA